MPMRQLLLLRSHDPLSLMQKQFPSGFLVAVLLTASGLLWAVMFFGPLAGLSPQAGSVSPFDIRPRGYSGPEANRKTSMGLLILILTAHPRVFDGRAI
jgi:hypothetical protein